MPTKMLSGLGATAIAGIIVASSAAAADFSNGSSAAWSYTPVVPATPVAPAAPGWYRGGNHWRGHHSMYGGEPHADFAFASPGWGGPWFYSPRTYSEPYRPAVIMPAPTPPAVATGPLPEPWTAQWYAYCSGRFQSFERSTGYYTNYSGDRRMCR